MERHEASPSGPFLASWNYDADGQLGLLDFSTRYTASGNWTVDVSSYDPRNRPTGRTWEVPESATGLSGSHTVTYGYDAADHQTSLTYPAAGGLDEEQVTTTYNSIGLPEGLNGAQQYVFVAAYDERARPLWFGYGNSSASTLGKIWTYDSNQRLSRQQVATNAGTVSDRTIAYDIVGNVTERNTNLAGGEFRECFGYDQRDRLTTAYTTSPSNTCTSGAGKGSGANPYNHQYTYTVDGNLKTRVESGVATTYTYPAGGATSTRPHAPTDVGSNTYTWNANGNEATRTVGGQTETFNWDAEHRLASITSPSGNSSYVYDPDGQRLLRTTPQGRTLYIEGHEITASTSGSVTAVRSYGMGGQPVATRSTTSGVDFLSTDNQGSVELTVGHGSSGTPEVVRTYLPYGKVRSGGQLASDRAWIGQVEDDHTGLQYLNARFYDPTIGIFTAADPIAAPGQAKSFNPYAYGRNNPVTLTDRSGLAPDPPATGLVQAPVMVGIGAVLGVAAAAAAAVGALAALAFAGRDLPNLPNLPDLPSRLPNLPDLPDLPDLPKLPSYCGVVDIGDCGPSLYEVAMAAEITNAIFSGTGVSASYQKAFYEQLLESGSWDADGNVYFVADSGVFMDRPGKPGDRAFFDAILNSDKVNLIVIDAVKQEVLQHDPAGTQAARLHGSVANVQFAADPSLPSAFNPTRKFGATDGRVVEASRQTGPPVLTSNRAMVTQVGSGNSQLCKGCGWDKVQFVTPP